MKKMSVVTLAFSASAAKAAAVTSLSLFAGLSKILLIGGALVGVLAAVGTVAAGISQFSHFTKVRFNFQLT